MNTAVATRITYQASFMTVYALTDEQLARIAAMRLQAARDYAAGHSVMEVYVSDIDLAEPEFRVPVADFAELRVMVEGHLQVANKITRN